MKVLLDNLFLVGQVIVLAALAWGAWTVLRDSLAGKPTPGAVAKDREKRSANPARVTQAHETRRAA
jgi:hypothetical protein